MEPLQYFVVWALYYIVVMIPVGLAIKFTLVMPDLGGLKVVAGCIILGVFIYLSVLSRTAARIFVFEKEGFFESLSDGNTRNLSTVMIWLCFMPVLGPFFQQIFQLDEETIKKKDNRRKLSGEG